MKPTLNQLINFCTVAETGNIGKAANFVHAPAWLSLIKAAPKVTKLPVTWAANKPCKAKKLAVST